MKPYIIAETIGESRIANHVVSIPEEKRYINITSIEAFRRRELSRIHSIRFFIGEQEPIRWFQVKSGEIDEEDIICPPKTPLPRFEHANVFDFYYSIGYDYKAKRFYEIS